MKIGLRILDEQWSTDNLYDFQRGKDGCRVLFREKLLSDLLAGTIGLQAVVSNDVAAAQSDLNKLSVRQLLRLRIRHLEFVPSGCGSNTVTGVGGTHEAFLASLDSLLFKQLGLTAVGECAPSSLSASLGAVDSHRLGRETVFFTAAARAIPSPGWWCWWLTDVEHVFFKPESFTCTRSFPDGGVLMMTDYSKRDQHEPTGHLRWFDWQVQHVKSQTGLPVVRPHEGASASGDGSPSKSSESPSGSATGAGVADKVSPQLLQSLRGNLRKTGVASAGVPAAAAPVEAG